MYRTFAENQEPDFSLGILCVKWHPKAKKAMWPKFPSSNENSDFETYVTYILGTEKNTDGECICVKVILLKLGHINLKHILN